MSEYKLLRKKYQPCHLITYKCPNCGSSMYCKVTILDFMRLKFLYVTCDIENLKKEVRTIEYRSPIEKLKEEIEVQERGV